MKFGVFTVMLGPVTGDEVIETAAECECDGIEWRAHPDYHLWIDTLTNDGAALVKRTRQAGMESFALASYAPIHEAETVDNLLAGAAELGIRSVRLAAPSYDHSKEYAAQADAARQHLGEIECLAAKHHVRALIELHMGNLLPNSAWARLLLDGFDPRHIGVIYDPGNMVWEGLEVWKMGIEALGPYLGHVHAKNSRWVATDEVTELGTRRWRSEWAPLNNGIVEWEAVIAALRQVDYDGWISLEDFCDESHPTERLRDGIRYLRTISEQ